ncbi:phototropic-responsive NPH3 family protein NPY1-like isoform X1 [Primulina tabacum]|uniref:phototropic-responsive NPH3 family protein NPY1-like isoform X1 n=2 Tax=Primulina tabacum TaxID=48773 RepID=UPI003F598AE0
MKFMKLGSKPDAFQSAGSYTRLVSSELLTDVIITIGEVKFHLHKFPLLSKSHKLRKLVSKSKYEIPDEIQLVEFPGGPKAFEICAKFCYGMVVTLNPYNVVAAFCAAEYLEMTEDIDLGNLVFKIDVFLNSCILQSWKDSIIVLQTTKTLLPWSESLKIVVARCIDSTASKTSADPSTITWSYTYNRKMAVSDKMVPSVVKFPQKIEFVPRDWWVEDICELDVDFFKQVIVMIKSKGRMEGVLIGEALRTYMARWLPDSLDTLVSQDHVLKNKSLVETIICLLLSDKGISCSCSFLFKLLKVASLIGSDDLVVVDLVRRVAFKLDEANVSDLLIPARSPQPTTYDIDLVQHLVEQFMTNGKQISKNNKNDGDFVLEHGSWLTVAKLIDGYLAEVACDPNLHVLNFIKLSRSIPESARPIHDELYAAINIYLKEHLSLSKAEKKNLCGLMDAKKLTRNAVMHAAQNNQLPLRVIIQILFFEQAIAAAGTNIQSQRKTEGNWTKITIGTRRSLREEKDGLTVREEDHTKNGNLKRKGSKNTRGFAGQQLPSRSRRFFDKLWIMGKGLGNRDVKSLETSASSQSPISMIQGETKSYGLSSRHRRYSVS